MALSGENTSQDAKYLVDYLSEVIKIVSSKVQDMENENKSLKEKEMKFEKELNEKISEAESYQSENTKLKEELQKLQEKYEKEQKRSNLLEVENNRNLDELKRLRKERNELLSKVEKTNVTLKDKIKNIINNS